jgi:hypothetical protein
MIRRSRGGRDWWFIMSNRLHSWYRQSLKGFWGFVLYIQNTHNITITMGKFSQVIFILISLFAYMYRTVYPTITCISILRVYLLSLYNCIIVSFKFDVLRGLIQVFSLLCFCLLSPHDGMQISDGVEYSDGLLTLRGGTTCSCVGLASTAARRSEGF